MNRDFVQKLKEDLPTFKKAIYTTKAICSSNQDILRRLEEWENVFSCHLTLVNLQKEMEEVQKLLKTAVIYESCEGALHDLEKVEQIITGLEHKLWAICYVSEIKTEGINLMNKKVSDLRHKLNGLKEEYRYCSAGMPDVMVEEDLPF